MSEGEEEVDDVVAVAEEAKLPLFTADTDSVSRGAIAALGFNYKDKVCLNKNVATSCVTS